MCDHRCSLDHTTECDPNECPSFTGECRECTTDYLL